MSKVSNKGIRTMSATDTMFQDHVQKQSPRGVLKNLEKWTGKHLCRSLCFNKIAGLRHSTDKCLLGSQLLSLSMKILFYVIQVRQRIGYCPQFDALIDLMTGRELLIMYSRLRGVPERHIDKLVIDLAVSLGVDEYIDKCSKTYRYVLCKLFGISKKRKIDNTLRDHPLSKILRTYLMDDP